MNPSSRFDFDEIFYDSFHEFGEFLDKQWNRIIAKLYDRSANKSCSFDFFRSLDSLIAIFLTSRKSSHHLQANFYVGVIFFKSCQINNDATKSLIKIIQSFTRLHLDVFKLFHCNCKLILLYLNILHKFGWIFFQVSFAVSHILILLKVLLSRVLKKMSLATLYKYTFFFYHHKSILICVFWSFEMFHLQWQLSVGFHIFDRFVSNDIPHIVVLRN